MIWARWAGVMGVPMKWEIARILVVGTGGSGFCAEAAPSGVIGFFIAAPPYPRAALCLADRLVEPGDHVGGDLVADGLVRELMARVFVQLHIDALQPRRLIHAEQAAHASAVLPNRIAGAGYQQDRQSPGNAAEVLTH